MNGRIPGIRTQRRQRDGIQEGRDQIMMRNTVRGVLGLILTGIAMWAADRLVDMIFGSEESA